MRRTVTTLLAALATSLLLAAPALAQSDAKIKEINFEDDHIAGDVLSPDDLRILELQKPDRVSLVRARPDFVDALLVAVEELGG